MFKKSIICAAVLAASVSVASAAEISPPRDLSVPDLLLWADAYKKDTGNGLNYQSIGSGAGLKQIRPRR